MKIIFLDKTCKYHDLRSKIPQAFSIAGCRAMRYPTKICHRYTTLCWTIGPLLRNVYYSCHFGEIIADNYRWWFEPNCLHWLKNAFWEILSLGDVSGLVEALENVKTVASFGKSNLSPAAYTWGTFMLNVRNAYGDGASLLSTTLRSFHPLFLNSGSFYGPGRTERCFWRSWGALHRSKF